MNRPGPPECEYWGQPTPENEREMADVYKRLRDTGIRRPSERRTLRDFANRMGWNATVDRPGSCYEATVRRFDAGGFHDLFGWG